MSPAHVLEPTYDAIKRRLMTGLWPAGFRLEAGRLADSLGVSITPVRDSLNRLTGERMVDFVHGEGFRVPRIGESELRDLLGLNQILLNAAIEVRAVPASVKVERSRDVAERTAVLFLRIAGRSGNSELMARVAALNDRMHLVRTLDEQILGLVDRELGRIEGALGQSHAARVLLRGLIGRYHERRLGAATEFARALGAGG